MTTHHLKHPLTIIVSFLVISLFLFTNTTEAAPCQAITNNAQTPSGFASPVSYFTNQQMIKGDCAGGAINVEVGNNSPLTYVYNTSYQWTGEGWEVVPLEGDNPQGAWYPEVATGEYSTSEDPSWYVAYTCEWINNSWKCGCTSSACSSNNWQIQAFVPPAPPAPSTPSGGEGSGGGGTPVSDEPRECSGSWQKVAEDKYGWYDSGRWVNGTKPDNIQARKDLSKGTAPDGSAAVEHRIYKGKPVYSPELDSPILYDKQGWCAVMLRYKMYNENNKWRTQGGKYIAIYGGRGEAGGYYLNRHPRPEGWSYFLLSPVRGGTKGTASAKNGLSMGVGANNASTLGASCGGHSSSRIASGKIAGGDPVNGDKQRCFQRFTGGTSSYIPSGQWHDIELIVTMNDKNTSNGTAKYTLNGKEIAKLGNILWMFEPDKSSNLYIEWRVMYGGTPERELPAYDFKEWFKDFELWVIK